MSTDPTTQTITFRVPGPWQEAQDLIDALPDECELFETGIRLPDGTEVTLNALEADNEFVSIFAGSCRRPPSLADQKIIENYNVNLCLSGPGGSTESVLRMLDAADMVLRAGGGGVFIDNSGVAMGSDILRALREEPQSPNLIRELVATVGGEEDLYSMGMHMFGLADVMLPRSASAQTDYFLLVDVLRLLLDDQITPKDRAVLDHPAIPRLRAYRTMPPQINPGHPMNNPFGMWRVKLCSDLKDEGEE